ncbi:MAG: hypothetical protein M3502_07210 [Actinomycetota bacterium]|nr:hypothetical protein [Actinomycetota bacterium]
MPADAGSGRVAADEHLDEILRISLHELRAAIAQPEHRLGEPVGGGELLPLVRVLEAEVAHAAAGGPSAHDDRLEVEHVEQIEERPLLLDGDELLAVDEAVGEWRGLGRPRWHASTVSVLSGSA